MNEASAEPIKFVIDKILKPNGVELTVKDIEGCFGNEEESLPVIKTALFQLVGSLIFENRADVKNFVKNGDFRKLTDTLRIFGFDPFMLDLESNSQHCWLGVCWLIWRFDLFKTLYDPLFPDEDRKYLPPFDEHMLDSTTEELQPPKQLPQSHEELVKRIQRLYHRIYNQLHELSDIEMQREGFNWTMRNIDPDSSLYDLSLKTNAPLLVSHTDALKRYVKNYGKIKSLFSIEKKFYESLTPILDRPRIDRTKYEDTRSEPIDFFPEAMRKPYSDHNDRVDELKRLLNSVYRKFTELKYQFNGLKETHKTNTRQFDLIRREIESKCDQYKRLEVLEEIPGKDLDEIIEGFIPTMPFKHYSDADLQRIIDTGKNDIDLIAKESCCKLSDLAGKICDELGFERHGWEIETHSKERNVGKEVSEHKPNERVSQKTKSITNSKENHKKERQSDAAPVMRRNSNFYDGRPKENGVSPPKKPDQRVPSPVKHPLKAPHRESAPEIAPKTSDAQRKKQQPQKKVREEWQY